MSQTNPSAYQFSPIDQSFNLASKRRIFSITQALTNAPPGELTDVVRDGFHPEAQVNIVHPLNETRVEALAERLWLPMRRALPDMERCDDIIAGGCYRQSAWVACLGHYVGTFEEDWLGIPATGGVVAVRFAEAHSLHDGKITASYQFIDFIDLMRQAGYSPIAPSLGTEMRWLPPATHDGLIFTPQDDAVSQRSIERVLAMHAGLGRYNRQPPTRAVLDEMHMVDHWHPHFMWYGPGGIGTTRGLAGFEEHHQIPFLCAFPDRGGTEIGHFIRIGDGHYAVTGGWGYLQATHTGGEFLGIPPTGKRIAMRVMDFYRCDDHTIVENWIPMDIPHILLQMGVDVFGRLRHQVRPRSMRAAPVADWLVKAADAPHPQR